MATGRLQIGWARGDITPPGKVPLQGQFYTRIAQETISPLTATALALETQDDAGHREQAVLLSCDLVREGVAARHGAAVHLLPQCAPAGDLSPHLLSDKKEEADLRQRLGVDAKGMIARRILAAIEEALATNPFELFVDSGRPRRRHPWT